MAANIRHEKICAVVMNIPKGCVSTYGDVARFAGYPRCARMVGAALRSASVELNLPWHRVVNAQGRISFPACGEKAQIQKKRLKDEGVFFISGVINLKDYGWGGELDKDLWQM